MILKHKAALAVLLAAATLLALAGLAGCSPSVTSMTSLPGETTSAEATTESEPAASTSLSTTEPPVKTTTAGSTSASSVTGLYLSESQAAAYARERVGDESRLLSISAEFEDNPPVYEIVLALGTYRYELEIHAITGAILEYERSNDEEEPGD
jgi:uncharacterized membrane protein YkoI